MGVGIVIGVVTGMAVGGFVWFRRVRVGQPYEPPPLRDAGSTADNNPRQPEA